MHVDDRDVAFVSECEPFHSMVRRGDSDSIGPWWFALHHCEAAPGSCMEFHAVAWCFEYYGCVTVS